MRKFDGKVALLMIKLAYENQKQGIGYRELQRGVRLVNHDKKFNKLMKKLREYEIFESIQKKPGQKIQIRLTKQKYKDYKNAYSWLSSTEFTFESDSRIILKVTRIKHQKFLCIAIMVRAAFGSTYEVRTTKPRRGDVMMQDPIDPDKQVCFTTISKPGIALDDITIRSIKPGRNARMLDTRNFTSLNEIFSQHLKISNQEAKKTIEYLENHEPPILKKIKYENRDRFEIADPILREFIEEWMITLTAVHQNIRNCYLRDELNRSYKLEYAKWNESLYGINSKIWENYIYLHNGRKHSSKRTKHQIKADCDDLNILEHLKILHGNSNLNPKTHYFKDISKNYPIVETMLRLTYPPFFGRSLAILMNRL